MVYVAREVTTSIGCPAPVVRSVTSTISQVAVTTSSGRTRLVELVGVAAADLAGAGHVDAPGVAGVAVGVARAGPAYWLVSQISVGGAITPS